MWLLGAALILTALRYFEIGVVANLSWWWVAAAYGLVVVWFEVLEKWLGLQRKQMHNDIEKARQARVVRGPHSAGRSVFSRKRR